MFLARANYRYRRMTDAVRLLPLTGALLWSVPLLWTRGETTSSVAFLYVFGVWLVLVVLAGLLARRLGRGGWSDEQSDPRLGEGEEPSQVSIAASDPGTASDDSPVDRSV